jgi:hypothetical protein
VATTLVREDSDDLVVAENGGPSDDGGHGGHGGRGGGAAGEGAAWRDVKL